MIAFILTLAAGALAGAFATILVLAALDARRFDRGTRRHPLPAAARHGLRRRLVRVAAAPAAGRELQRKADS